MAKILEFPADRYEPPENRLVKRELDEATARALVESGYMPLERYLELYGSAARHR